MSVWPLKGSFGDKRGKRALVARLNRAPLKIGLRRGGPGKLKNRQARSPDKGLKSTSPRIGHFRGWFDRFGNTNGQRCPTRAQIGPFAWRFGRLRNANGRRASRKGSDRRRPKLATSESVLVNSETPRVGKPQQGAQIDVAPNRLLSMSPPPRSIWRNKLRKMPGKGPKSTSPRIGHVRGRFNRLGNTESRRCPAEGPDRRPPESEGFLGASIDSERPRVGEPWQGARIDVDADRPS